MKCDLNDLQKLIVQAFNVDIRQHENENREITLYLLDGTYTT